MQPLTHTKRKAQKSTEKHHEKSENVSTTIGFARAHLHVDDTILVKLQNGDEFYGEIVNLWPGSFKGGNFPLKDKTPSFCAFTVSCGEGGTHILRHTGMCLNFGSVFWKNSLNMGPIFNEKIPKYGSDFQKLLG